MRISVRLLPRESHNAPFFLSILLSARAAEEKKEAVYAKLLNRPEGQVNELVWRAQKPYCSGYSRTDVAGLISWPKPQPTKIREYLRRRQRKKKGRREKSQRPLVDL